MLPVDGGDELCRTWPIRRLRQAGNGKQLPGVARMIDNSDRLQRMLDEHASNRSLQCSNPMNPMEGADA